MKHDGSLGASIGEHLVRAARALEANQKLASTVHVIQESLHADCAPHILCLRLLKLLRFTALLAQRADKNSSICLLMAVDRMLFACQLVVVPLKVQVYSFQHKRFRAMRCGGFDVSDGTHELTAVDDPAAATSRACLPMELFRLAPPQQAPSTMQQQEAGSSGTSVQEPAQQPPQQRQAALTILPPKAAATAAVEAAAARSRLPEEHGSAAGPASPHRWTKRGADTAEAAGSPPVKRPTTNGATIAPETPSAAQQQQVAWVDAALAVAGSCRRIVHKCLYMTHSNTIQMRGSCCETRC